MGWRQPWISYGRLDASPGDEGSFTRAAAGRNRADNRRGSAYARAQERDHALARRTPEWTGGRGGTRAQAEARRQVDAVQRRADGARYGQRDPRHPGA